MHKEITETIVSVCKSLAKNDVEYLIVGGTAVALHGYFRWSHNQSGAESEKYDLDIWYNPTYQNYFKLLNVIEELGQDVTEWREEKTPTPKSSFFKFEMDKITLDFLPKLKEDSKFRTSFGKKEIVTINNTNLYVINFDDLLKDKGTNPRPKDLTDIMQLREKNKKT